MSVVLQFLSVPTMAPQNASYSLQSPLSVLITWDPPPLEHRHGDIVNYTVHFQQKFDAEGAHKRNVTGLRTVFKDLLKDTDYVFKLQAYTRKGERRRSLFVF